MLFIYTNSSTVNKTIAPSKLLKTVFPKHVTSNLANDHARLGNIPVNFDKSSTIKNSVWFFLFPYVTDSYVFSILRFLWNRFFTALKKLKNLFYSSSWRSYRNISVKFNRVFDRFEFEVTPYITYIITIRPAATRCHSFVQNVYA